MNKKKMLTLVLAGVFALIAVVSVYAATCYTCKGYGVIRCSTCNGTGQGKGYTQHPDGTRSPYACVRCGGDGTIMCYTCAGSGER